MFFNLVEEIEYLGNLVSLFHLHHVKYHTSYTLCFYYDFMAKGKQLLKEYFYFSSRVIRVFYSSFNRNIENNGRNESQGKATCKPVPLILSNVVKPGAYLEGSQAFLEECLSILRLFMSN